MRLWCTLVLGACSMPRPDLDVLHGMLGARMPVCAVDALEENRAALAEVHRYRAGPRADYDVLIVPGYSDDTPADVPHAIARERLLRAVITWRNGGAPFILVSGGSVRPADNPVNEALAMKRYLVAGGVGPEHILLEPCARHSTTNLRNAGRMMIQTGLLRGRIVTSVDQAFYFMRPRSSTFYSRCLRELGYMVGKVWRVDAQNVGFTPSELVTLPGDDPLDP
jgi:hypothetical protein